MFNFFLYFSLPVSECRVHEDYKLQGNITEIQGGDSRENVIPAKDVANRKDSK